MNKPEADPFEGLQRAFHEPKRLAIMSALAGSPLQELTFNEIKALCDLTDGNLSRHLKTLEETGAVAFRKSKGPARPQTVVSLTVGGRVEFARYLGSLEEVLKRAGANLTGTEVPAPPRGSGVPAA